MNSPEKFNQEGGLSQDEARAFLRDVLSGSVTTPELLKVFGVLDKRMITREELEGFFDAARESMVKVEVDGDILDTAGTGGDGLRTFNISTVAAFICAACGVAVAKHGNRSASGTCGSADVLEALGAAIELTPQAAKTCLEETGMTFFFAPIFHPAFKKAREARTLFGKRTFFNLLGPMLNPAETPYQLIGLSDERYASLMGGALQRQGRKRVWIFTGGDNMDEISPSSKTRVTEFSGQNPAGKKFTIDPATCGLNPVPLSAIQAKNVEECVSIFLAVLGNEANEGQTNAALLNAAAGLTVFGKTRDMKEGIAMAREALESGKARRKLQEFIKFSNDAKHG